METHIQAHSQTRIELQLLAYPRLLIDGRPAELRLKRGLALLALLAEAQRPLSRALAAALLWPDADDRTARSRLRRLMHEVNQQLDHELIAGDADMLQLGGALSCDLHALRRIAHDADVAASQAGLLLQPGAHQLLTGFVLDSDSFSDWLDSRRSEHATLVGRALQRAAVRWAAAGDSGSADAAYAASERLIHIDPCSEDGYIARIVVLAQRGDSSGVENTYFACAQTLRRELGVKPSMRLEQAYAEASASLALQAARAAPAPAVRYADTGAGHVAYISLGQGPQTLILNWGLMSNLEVALEEPRARRLIEQLARRHRVVMFDRRGCGLSERVGIEPTLAAGARDLEAVLDAIGARQAWIFGGTAGGTVGIEFAATRPERTAGLLLFGTPARGAWAHDYPWAMQPADLADWIDRLACPERSAEGLRCFAPSAADAPAVQAWYARLLRQSVSRNGAAAMLRGYLAMDVRHRLASVRAPTLVMQRRGDRVVPAAVGQLLADRIPHAELAVLEGDDHFLWHGDADSVLQAVLSFIARQRAPGAAAHRTASGRGAGTMDFQHRSTPTAESTP